MIPREKSRTSLSICLARKRDNNGGSYLKRQARRLVECIPLIVCVLFLVKATPTTAQSVGALQGRILDPSGAVVPGAEITLTLNGHVTTTKSGAEGNYIFKELPFGRYSLSVAAEGFAQFERPDVMISGRQPVVMDIPLIIQVKQENVTVPEQNTGVSLSSDENASAITIRGSELDALSDEPGELQNELQALAGPATGPNGGQIYIDGFTGGQLPPKTAIREIRINQNPFSAEFDRLGYGRIEILTKPGSQKFSGQLTVLGTDSAWNTSDPLVREQPSYYLYSIQGNVTGPLSRHSSYFMSFYHLDQQDQNIIDAIDPNNPTTTIQEALPNPTSTWKANPRLDFQLGASNTLSIRDAYFRTSESSAGVGQLNLPEQAYSALNLENDVQVGDTVVVNARLLNETNVRWRYIRSQQLPASFLPTVSVEGAFTTGGNNAGVLQDHQNDIEFQNYSTLAAGKHTIRFGTRLRLYEDANYSTSGANGEYLFGSLNQYEAGTPEKYQQTIVTNPLARVTLFDGSLFYQDEWRWKPNLTISDGLRYEGQNRIHDHDDWAPRVAVAWAPGRQRSKTVVRAGYGWFYNRFAVPNSFSSSVGSPYIVEAIHQNGINSQSYVVNNPPFYNPNSVTSAGTSSASIPSIYSVDSHFHAALDMQGAVGVDQQVGKRTTLNITYLYTRGVHQYLTNNVTAPEFDPSTYTVTGSTPSQFNYQFQSAGVYKQHELIATATIRYQKLSLHGYYAFTEAHGNTEGVSFVPSDAHNLALDYGRNAFDVTHRVFLIGTYSAPYGIVLANAIYAQSGTPYNVVVGSDLTANNQFNARPTYGTCGEPGVIATSFGCLDSDPTGKSEKIVPYGLGTGPANFIMNTRVSKTIGIGPRIGGAHESAQTDQGGGVGSRGLGASQARAKWDASVARRYSLTFVLVGSNLFNYVNLAPPNGTLESPLFGRSQALASGAYSTTIPGNRGFFGEVLFKF